MDIRAARNRRLVHPEATFMFATEFKLGPDPAANVIFMYLVTPLGFNGSPGIFGSVAKAVGMYRQKRRPD